MIRSNTVPGASKKWKQGGLFEGQKLLPITDRKGLCSLPASIRGPFLSLMGNTD